MLDDNDIKKLKETFLTKDLFLEVGVNKEDIKELDEKFVTKVEFNEFKNTSLSKLDEILDGVNSLKQEKTFKDAQDKREKEVLKIHNEALKRNKILTEEESLKISQSSVF